MFVHTEDIPLDAVGAPNDNSFKPQELIIEIVEAITKFIHQVCHLYRLDEKSPPRIL